MHLWGELNKYSIKDTLKRLLDMEKEDIYEVDYTVNGPHQDIDKFNSNNFKIVSSKTQRFDNDTGVIICNQTGNNHTRYTDIENITYVGELDYNRIKKAVIVGQGRKPIVSARPLVTQMLGIEGKDLPFEVVTIDIETVMRQKDILEDLAGIVKETSFIKEVKETPSWKKKRFYQR